MVVDGPNEVLVTIQDVTDPACGVAVQVDDRGQGFDFERKVQELERV